MIAGVMADKYKDSEDIISALYGFDVPEGKEEVFCRVVEVLEKIKKEESQNGNYFA